jgi:hypothetical protein
VKTSETKAGETDVREEGEQQDGGGGFPDDYGMPEMPDQVKIAAENDQRARKFMWCWYMSVCVCVCVCVYTYTACLCLRA